MDSAAQILAQLRDAAAVGLPLKVRGNGSKPWMHAASAAQALPINSHSGVISYEPTELVVTVRAGTPLQDLEMLLAERDQMLAMEAPNFNGNSTIGGAVALGWSGSRSPFAGGVRDTVLGLRMVNGLGEDLSFGGQVMKNVAGFDVSRLMVGSCGQLGAILELSLRVLPRPQQELTLCWPQPDLAATRTVVADWRRLGYPVSAASYTDGVLHARFSGSTAMLAELRQALLQKMGGEESDGAYWRNLQFLELPLFHSGWGDDKLFDCNGDVCWTAHTRQRGNGPRVGLAEGPQTAVDGKALSTLQQRVAAAFDPAGLFGLAGAAAAETA